MNSRLGNAEVDDDWPDNAVGKSLFKFEDCLKCKICRDYFDNPQVLPCGHTFCTICLTKRFDRKLNPNATESCPICRSGVETKYMRLNHELVSIIESFKSMRKTLQSHLVKANSECCDCKVQETSSSRSSSRRGPHQQGTFIRKKVPLRSFHDVPLNKVRDALLSVSSNPSGISLSTSGDKTALERRYRMFMHLHNAQIDSPTPLLLEEVIKQINSEEQAAFIEAHKETASSATLNALKNGKSNKQVDDGYKTLIKMAKANKKKILAASKTKNSENTNDLPAVTNDDQSQSMEDIVGNKYEAKELELSPELGAIATSDLPDNSFASGPWKVLMSATLNRPFYYNSDTKTGQFSVPNGFDGNMKELNTSSSSAKAASNIYTESSPGNHSSCDLLTQLSISSEIPTFQNNHCNMTDYSPDHKQFRTDDGLRNNLDLLSQEHAMNVPLRLSPSQEYVTIDNDVKIIDEKIVSIDRSPSKADGDSSWICELCTFKNLTQSKSCEMCYSTNIMYLQTLSSQVSPSQSQSKTRTQSQLSFFQSQSSLAQRKTPTKRSTQMTLDNSGESKKSRKT